MIAKRRRKNKKWIMRLVFLILIIVSGVICYFVWESYFKDKSGSELDEDGTVEMIEQPQRGEEEILEETVEEKKVILYEGEDPNESEDLTGVITYAGVSGNILMVRVNIDQYLSGGNCELSLMRGGEVVYSDSAAIIDSAATATCEGFNVPVGSLETGNYGIIIKLSSGGKIGTISGEVDV